MPNPRAVEVVLSDEERERLEAWARRRESAQALAQRSRIVLCAAQGLKNSEIAERLRIRRGMAAKWRSRFAGDRLVGLVDEPRPGRPRKIGDAQVEEVIIRTLETTPSDATHLSTRSMAREVGLSQTAVSRIWRAFGLQPHRAETWKLSRDPQFVDKVRDVVGLYLDPPERAVVLCVDVKSQIQALDRSAPVLPMLPGTPERATHDYKRSGTSSLYAALDIGSGRLIGSLHARHRAVEFKKFLRAARSRGPRRARGAPDPRQRLDAQDAGDQEVACRPPALCPPLHPDQRLPAQPRRALVRRANDQEAAPRHPPLGPPAQRRHPRLDRDLEPQPTPLRPDQDRRRDPRLNRPLLQANQRLTTLAVRR
jgi:transposase